MNNILHHVAVITKNHIMTKITLDLSDNGDILMCKLLKPIVKKSSVFTVYDGVLCPTKIKWYSEHGFFTLAHLLHLITLQQMHHTSLFESDQPEFEELLTLDSKDIDFTKLKKDVDNPLYVNYLTYDLKNNEISFESSS